MLGSARGRWCNSSGLLTPLPTRRRSLESGSSVKQGDRPAVALFHFVRRGARRAAATMDKERGRLSPIAPCATGRRPSIPYPVAQRATHLSCHRPAEAPSADRRQPRVLFGAALVARLRQWIKERGRLSPIAPCATGRRPSNSLPRSSARHSPQLHRPAEAPSADRRQPRVLFGAALVARLRQWIKREDD